MPVFIKRDFVVARGGTMIHLVGDQECHNIQWHPNAHEWGFSEFGPDLHVKLACRYPSYLKNPLLITQAQGEELKFDNGEVVPFCKHCAKAMIR
jgi:hypothetical protein